MGRLRGLGGASSGAVQNHDTSMRALFKRRGVARAFLKHVLPAWLEARVVGQPEILSESFIGDDLRAEVADVVLRVRLDGLGALVVYIVIEHKRTEERFALVQVLRYMTSIYEQQVRERSGGTLAPVLPVIIFNGPRAWRGPTRFSQLLSLDAPTVDFEVVLMDLRRLGVDQLSSHRTLRGGLLSLKAAATPVEELDAVLDAVLVALRGDPSTLRFFLRYLAAVAGADALPLVQRAAERQKEEDQVQTIAEYLREQGLKKGLKEGREEGREEGLKKGLKKGLKEGRNESVRLLRSSLRRVLRVRFGKVSKTTSARVARAELEALAAWIERAATAEKLRDVFAPH